MCPIHPTIIWRHRRENLKKCTLRGLEGRPDFLFFLYPRDSIVALDNYLLLSVNAAPLSPDDRDQGLLLLDGTWRYSMAMEKTIESVVPPERKRSLPAHFITAYPRRQHDCPDPGRGLASIEALYLAYSILGYETTGLLDLYYWRDAFLKANALKLMSTL